MRWLFAVFALSLVLAPVPVPAAPSTSPFGINGASWSHLGANTDAFDWDRGMKRLDALQAMGAVWDRCDFWWHVIEPEPGKFNYRDYDRVVSEYEKRGLLLLPILAYDAAWHPQQSPNTEAYREEYGRFVYETVRHFKGRITAYEIWNEPNVSLFWRKIPRAEDYAALLKVAYREAKRADPNVTVVGGAVAGMDWTFIESILRLGAGQSMDALSVHPYQGNLGSIGPHDGRLVDDLVRLKSILKAAGHERLPIWITEIGHRTVPDPSIPEGQPQPSGRVSEQKQAQYLVHTYALALSHGVEKIFWFNLQDWPTETWGTVDENFRRKPSWSAYRTMVQQIGHAPQASPVAARGGLYLVRFAQKNPVLLGWTENTGQTIGMKDVSGYPTVVQCDITGQETSTKQESLAVHRDRASLPLTSEPLYILGLKAFPTVASSPVEVRIEPETLSPGSAFSVGVRYLVPEIRDLLDKAQPEITVYPSAEPDVSFRVTRTKTGWRLPEEGLEPGHYVAKVRWPVSPNGSNTRGWAHTLSLNVVPPVEVHASPSPMGTRDILITVRNNTAAALYATVMADVKGNRIDTNKNVHVLPGKTATVDVTNALPASAALSVPAAVSVRVETPAGDAHWDGNVYFMTAGYQKPGTVMRLHSAQQWQSQDGTWNGPDDLSARIVASWDKSALHLRAVVTDDEHVQPNVLSAVWRADAFQVAIDPHWERRPDILGCTEFGLALTPSGPQVYRWTGQTGLVPGAQLSVTRSGKETTYVASIAWKEMGVDASRLPRSLGFSILLNDADGPIREGWLAYGDGIGIEKRSDRYGTLTLMAP